MTELFSFKAISLYLSMCLHLIHHYDEVVRPSLSKKTMISTLLVVGWGPRWLMRPILAWEYILSLAVGTGDASSWTRLGTGNQPLLPVQMTLFHVIDALFFKGRPNETVQVTVAMDQTVPKEHDTSMSHKHDLSCSCGCWLTRFRPSCANHVGHRRSNLNIESFEP